MYPKHITINAESYAITVDHNSSNEIQYFNLIDSNGDIFYETDWEGDFTREDVLMCMQVNDCDGKDDATYDITTGLFHCDCFH